MFPHHECEIAQTVAGYGKESVRYWMHNNMITLNGQKMGKSLGNAISLEQFFTGDHKLLDKGYSPMCIRFFMMQAHYRSTLDFSNESLLAAEKGLERLFEGMANLDKISPSEESGTDVSGTEKSFYEAMNDDFNSPVAIAHLFDGIKVINGVFAGNGSFSSTDLEQWKSFYKTAVSDMLGLSPTEASGADDSLNDSLIRLLLQMRTDARDKKDFEQADRIRDEMINMGIEVKDTKDGFEWKLIK